MESGLPSVEKVDPRLGESSILFEGNPDFLSSPLWERSFDIDLDSIAGIIKQGIISFSGHSVLSVPQADGGTGTVTMVSQRMGIDLGL